jgi:hypothetical protein
MAALRQYAPIVIEDQELARPFARLLRARRLQLWALGEFVADTMSCAIDRSYGTNIEAYLAGSLFTTAERDFNAALAALLRAKGHEGVLATRARAAGHDGGGHFR